jgi:plastocyanin
MTRSRSLRILGIALVMCFVSRRSSGETPQEVEALKADLRALQNEVSALRMALSEAAELDRQRAAVISRALEGGRSSEGIAPSLPSPEVGKRSESRGSERASSPKSESAKATQVSVLDKRRGAKAGAAAGSIVGKVTMPEGEPVAYVYVENMRAPAKRGEKVVIEQVRKKFSPWWAVIRLGTSIEFPNRDNIYHNVFSRSPGNSFDLGLYSSGETAKAHTFTEPGPVDIYCNIHPHMAASILVVPNGYFAKVGPDGTFKIADVPAGGRKVSAWAPNSAVVSRWIDVSADNAAQADFTLQSKAQSHMNKEGRPYGSYP